MHQPFKTSLSAGAIVSFLALTGGFAASPVSAQSLSLVTADGTISGSGTAVSGSYTYGGGASGATSAYSSVDTNTQSTLALQSGGSITNLSIHDSSTATISGGSVGTLTSNGHFGASFSITGGTVGAISDGSVGTLSTISGGTVGNIDDVDPDLQLAGGPLAISGGDVGNVVMSSHGVGGGTDLKVSGGSVQSVTSYAGTTEISGGSVGSLTLNVGYDGSGNFVGGAGSISGGTVGDVSVLGIKETNSDFFNSTVYTTCNITGGTVGTLIAADYGGYDLFGSDLHLTDSGYITGILSNGQVIDSVFTNTDGKGFLQFNNIAAVPEASTTLSLSLLLMLGLGGMVVAAKRKKAATAV